LSYIPTVYIEEILYDIASPHVKTYVTRHRTYVLGIGYWV